MYHFLYKRCEGVVCLGLCSSPLISSAATLSVFLLLFFFGLHHFCFIIFIYQPKLRDMPNEILEEEIQALMSDKCVETEYQESLQNQIDTIKGILHTVRCDVVVEKSTK